MQVSTDDIFELAEIENLLALEWAWVRSAPLAIPSGPVISLCATRRRGEPGLATRDSIARLHIGSQGLTGDTHCSLDALPFESDSAQVVVVRHLFDVLGRHGGLESELLRVLAPGGALFVFGFNPASTWRLWWLRQAVHGMRMPSWNSLGQTRTRLASIDHVQSQQGYLGGAWPSMSTTNSRVDGKRWQGAWLLIARKQRIAARPIDLHARRKRVVLAPGLARMSSRRVGP